MKNNFKTVLLLGSLTGLMILIGNMIGGRSGAAVGLGFAVVMNFVSYWFSDKIALRMSGAKPVSAAEAPELYRMVAKLCEAAGTPMPSIHIIPSQQANAFATGRNPQHAAVAVTQGLLEFLEPGEVEAVLAHEMAHVKNRDILIASIAATIAGAISWLAMMARWGALLGGSDDEDSHAGLFGMLVAAIVAPIAAVLVQMAISRSREFQADATGARLTGRPELLASALRKIESVARQVPMAVDPAHAQLFIVNPLRGNLAAGAARLFMTHPPVEERVARLESLIGRT